MKSQAITDLYPNAKRIIEESNGSVQVFDEQGTSISIDSSAVSAQETVVVAQHNLSMLRKERDNKLAETDYWVFSDTATATQAQLDYRQALRDITNTYTSLDDVVWPEKP